MGYVVWKTREGPGAVDERNRKEDLAPAPAQTAQTLSPESLREVADEVKGSFVRAPGKPGLVLIEIDPHRLHAFWTVNREAVVAARDQLGTGGEHASLVLRVLDAESNETGSLGGSTFDVDVGGLQSRSYVDIFGERRRYRAILGLRAPDNRFVTLAKSNPVELPPTSSLGSDGFLQINIESPESGPFTPQPASPGGEGSATTSFPSLEPWPGHEHEHETPWTDGPRGTAAEQSPAAPPSGADAQETRPPLVLEQALTSSSYGLGRAGGFEVIAELHVHGHADPDQDLHLFGQKVPLRPDGSFSIRRILPNDPSLIEALLNSGDASTDHGDG